jgi:hypothetical protein
MQGFLNPLAYFATVVSYACKMFMKLTPEGDGVAVCLDLVKLAAKWKSVPHQSLSGQIS